MDTLTAKEANDRLHELIDVATKEKQQFTITSDIGDVVLLPKETYENILVTLELLSTPGLMDNLDFLEGDQYSGNSMGEFSSTQHDSSQTSSNV